jgi:voltage-gated potassium channel
MQNKSRKFLFYFAGLITVSSIGFKIIGGPDWSVIDSIFMTVITLSTVGFSEVHELTAIGRVWAIIVIIFGVSGVAVMISRLGEEIIEFQQNRTKKITNKIRRMRGHYIICGYGRMGIAIAKELNQLKIRFVVIEHDENRIQDLIDANYTYIRGDATHDETLISAGIKNTKGIVVTLGTDQDNLFVTMSARTLNQEAYLISRCSSPETRDKLLRAGANKVVNPYTAGGIQMAELLLSPSIGDAVTVSAADYDFDMVMEDFKVKNIPDLSGKAIRNTKLREDFDLMVIGVIDNQKNANLNPAPEFVLNEEHTIILIGTKDNIRLFRDSI